MVCVSFFELAVRILREFSGRSNLGHSEPWYSPGNRENKIEVRRYPGSNEVTIVYIIVNEGIFELAVRILKEFSGRSNLGQSKPW